jgi:hypothetical protein
MALPYRQNGYRRIHGRKREQSQWPSFATPVGGHHAATVVHSSIEEKAVVPKNSVWSTLRSSLLAADVPPQIMIVHRDFLSQSRQSDRERQRSALNAPYSS